MGETERTWEDVTRRRKERLFSASLLHIFQYCGNIFSLSPRYKEANIACSFTAFDKFWSSMCPMVFLRKQKQNKKHVVHMEQNNL